jgi:hypothetical protein
MVQSRRQRACSVPLRAELRWVREIDRGQTRPEGLGRDSRKEVIQPQVPLRLPCYDFTPVARHSLRTYLPCGLARPFLEQRTPMV